MNVKYFVPFVLLLGLVSCGLATPTPRSQRDVSEENLVPKEVEESMKKIAAEVENATKKLVENFQWIYKSFGSIARNTMQEGLQKVASWAADFVVRIEFFSMADGSHMYFPLNGKSEIEQDYKTVAKAVTKLLMNLKTMERTNEVVKNVSIHLITKDTDPHMQEHKENPEKWLRTLLHLYFETLDHQMEADEDLRTEYKQRKIEAREEVKRDPKMRGPLLKLWERNVQYSKEEIENLIKDLKTLQQGVVNKVFLKHSTKHFEMLFSALHHRRYLLARALIQKARSVSKSDSKINKVYHQALVQAVEADTFEQMANMLFNSIESALQSDRTLNEEIQTIMKQIEGSTVYDTDMFNVDFSFL